MEYTGWPCDRRYLRPPSFEPSHEQLFGFYILSCSNRFDELDRQISEDMQQENEVNSEKLLMRRMLAFETRVGVDLMTQEKESRLGGAGSVVWTGLLRRCDGGDGLQVEGNDLGTDHFARDDQFDAAVLLAAFGGIV